MLDYASCFPYTSFVLQPLPAYLTTQQSRVKASLFINLGLLNYFLRDFVRDLCDSGTTTARKVLMTDATLVFILFSLVIDKTSICR